MQIYGTTPPIAQKFTCITEIQREAKTLSAFSFFFFLELSRLNLFRSNDEHHILLKEYNNFP